jgi:hypothetical protein
VSPDRRRRRYEFCVVPMIAHRVQLTQSALRLQKRRCAHSTDQLPVLIE